MKRLLRWVFDWDRGENFAFALLVVVVLSYGCYRGIQLVSPLF